MKDGVNTIGAVAAGLFLASLPFITFGVGGKHSHDAGPQMDHASRHGGQLGMVGDYHLELVQDDGRLLVYVTDAQRRPVSAARGALQFDDDEPIPMQHERFCMSGPGCTRAADVTCAVWLEDGTHLESTFGLDTVTTASE